jgi:hypothetical protein
MPADLKIFSVGSIVLFVFFALCKIAYRLLHFPRNAVWWIFPREFRFTDYNCFQMRFQGFHHPWFFDPHAGLVFMYPAPSAMLYQLFYLLPLHRSVVIFELVMGLLVLVVAHLFAKLLIRRGVSQEAAYLFVGIAVFFSYPFMIDFYLANIEVAMGLLIGFALERWLRGASYTAAVLFGLAGSMKIFPFIFLALLLSRKQYRQIIVSIAVAVVSTVFSLWMVSGSISGAWHGIAGGLENFRINYALTLSPVDVAIDHSLFGVAKGFLNILRLQPTYEPLARALSLYLVCSAVAGLTLYFVWIRKLPIINQVLLICTLGILLPPASHDYTLMHLYVPWGLLVLLSLEAARTGRHVPGLRACFLCLTLLLVPLGEILIHDTPQGGTIKGLLLLVLTWIGLHYPFKSEEAYENEPGTSTVPASNQS